MPSIHGVDVDEQGRCTHYDSPVDVVAIRFPCCDRYYACHRCHRVLADHEARRWRRTDFRERAVHCGHCLEELEIREYLRSTSDCPRCGGSFNPRCARHHSLYFEG